MEACGGPACTQDVAVGITQIAFQDRRGRIADRLRVPDYDKENGG